MCSTLLHSYNAIGDNLHHSLLPNCPYSGSALCLWSRLIQPWRLFSNHSVSTDNALQSYIWWVFTLLKLQCTNVECYCTYVVAGWGSCPVFLPAYITNFPICLYFPICCPKMDLPLPWHIYVMGQSFHALPSCTLCTTPLLLYLYSLC